MVMETNPRCGDSSGESTPLNRHPEASGTTSTTIPTIPTIPSIVVEEAVENSDEPPPYSSVVPPDHIGWPFDFSTGIPYSGCSSCNSGNQLARFQMSQAGAGEGQDGQHTSIMMPLMPCQFFKFGSHRSLFVQRPCVFSDATPVTKSSGGKTRRYGAILVAAAVIAFLMALSLLVRFIVEGKFWRG